MKIVDMLPLKIGLAAASLAAAGIVAVALSSPDDVEVPACTTICSPPPPAAPVQQLAPQPAADY